MCYWQITLVKGLPWLGCHRNLHLRLRLLSNASNCSENHDTKTNSKLLVGPDSLCITFTHTPWHSDVGVKKFGQNLILVVQSPWGYSRTVWWHPGAAAYNVITNRYTDQFWQKWIFAYWASRFKNCHGLLSWWIQSLSKWESRKREAPFSRAKVYSLHSAMMVIEQPNWGTGYPVYILVWSGSTWDFLNGRGTMTIKSLSPS